MDVHRLTAAYEALLARRVRLVPADLRRKHRLLAQGPFPFLRGTFYLWARRWRERCPELADAPRVLGVGDLHVANFGTWRDAEGRLVWGVNDLDEAWACAYAQDLVRLATSAVVAEEIALSPSRICAAVLAGYRDGLKDRGSPYVLEERNGWLRALALGALHDPAGFWRRIEGLPRLRGALPAEARRAIAALLPSPRPRLELRARVAGVGSLGLPRVVAVAADVAGGAVAREAKARAPSALAWAEGRVATGRSAELLAGAVRARDPFLAVTRRWVVRRLSPDCAKVELADLPARRDEERLLRAMGREVANVHLGSGRAVAAVERDLARRPDRWLLEAARRMAETVVEDARAWARGRTAKE